MPAPKRRKADGEAHANNNGGAAHLFGEIANRTSQPNASAGLKPRRQVKNLLSEQEKRRSYPPIALPGNSREGQGHTTV